MMTEKESAKQLQTLAWLLAEKKIEPSCVLPAIAELADGDIDIEALSESLANSEKSSLANLRRQLWEARRAEALKWHDASQDSIPPLLTGLPANPPRGWRQNDDASGIAFFPNSRCLRFMENFLPDACPKLVSKLSEQALTMSVPGLLSLAKDAIPLLAGSGKLGNLQDAINAAQAADAEKARAAVSILPLKSLAGMPNSDSTLQALGKVFTYNIEKRVRLAAIDTLATWPFRTAAEHLKNAIIHEAWAKERVALVLTMRFGQPAFVSAQDWIPWLDNEIIAERKSQDALKSLLPDYAPEIVLSWCMLQDSPDEKSLECLERICKDRAATLSPGAVASRCASLLDNDEKQSLLEMETSKTPFAEQIPVSAKKTEPPPVSAPTEEPKKVSPSPAPAVVAEPLPPPPPPKPAAPSLWDTHLQPFFAEHWYMFAGILMMLVGTSVLAYYTWDKHWLLRYTILPVILGGFTWGLAWSGGRLERRDRSLADMGTMLRGAAISLLPVNFMALVLLASDPSVTCKHLAVPLISLLYLGLAAWGVRRWCAEVHAGIAALLGNSVLILNSLIVLVALAIMAGLGKDSDWMPSLLIIGTYVCFGEAMVSLLRFSRRVLTSELSEEKRVPWFFSSMVTITFLQAFIWTHCFLGVLPDPGSYAPLLILAGGLVFYAERRALELKGKSELMGAESFIGFALLIIGLLMGNTNQFTRVICFFLAGAVWIYQAAPRRNEMQQWIGLILLSLGVVSFGFFTPFPPEWRPVLGLIVALLLGAAGLLLRKYPSLVSWERSCFGLQAAVLPLTAVVGVLAQWHYHSRPLGTALLILAVCAVMCWRCRMDRQAWWLHTVLPLLALTLPYLGFAELPGLHHNNLDLGFSLLALLWLVACRIIPGEPLLGTRSLGIFFYGLLASAAIFFRVLFSGPQDGDLVTLSTCILLAFSLGAASWYSRSLLPSLFALAGISLLCVEMLPAAREFFGFLHRGSGVASTSLALALLLLSLIIERMPQLRELQGGDLFLGGRFFPWQRRDHTLFTWPLLAAALYLIVRSFLVCVTWKIVSGQATLLTALTLGLTGLFWTLLAVHLRRHSIASFLTHLGWIGFFGAFCVAHWKIADKPHWEYPVLATLVLLQVMYWSYRRFAPLSDWGTRVLLNPLLRVLRWGSLTLLFFVLMLLLRNYPLDWHSGLLAAFLGLQMIWHGLAIRLPLHGTLLFIAVVAALAAWCSPGPGNLPGRLSFEHTLTPLLLFSLAVFAVQLLLERMQSLWATLKPLLAPAFAISLALSIPLGLLALLDAFLAVPHESALQTGLTFALILLAARAQGFSPLALLAAFIAYGLLSRAPQGTALSERIELIFSPWRLSLFAFSLALLGRAGQELSRRMPALLTGPFAFKPLCLTSAHVFYGTGFVLALLATTLHSVSPAFRNSLIQILTPYLAAGTLCVWASAARHNPFLYGVSALLLCIGNIHFLHVCAGDWLISHGLSHLHIVCLGLALTMLQTSLLRILLRRRAADAFLNQTAATCAGIALSLLAFNYFAHPDLSKVEPFRFLASAMVALLAALYFRQAARHPAPGEEKYVYVIEGFYHLGLALAMWCLALLIPFLRTPQTVMIALGVPVIYFFVCAEISARLKREVARNYRDSATVLSFVLLGLYVFRLAFQMLLFPSAPLDTSHYHYNAPLLLVLAPLMFRLHALGGSWWLAFYGGLSLMAGSFFMISYIPGLSPFANYVAAAWVAIALGHFWTLASNAKSPLRTAMQRLGALDDNAWDTLRRIWGYCLLAAVTLMSTIGLISAASNYYQHKPVFGKTVLQFLNPYALDSYLFAPLLLGLASIYLHHGILRRAWPYFAVAGTAILVALHVDFLMPSHLPKDYVVLAVLLLWAALLTVERLVKDAAFRSLALQISAGAFLLSMLHVIMHHHPWSIGGLWAGTAAALLAALSPVKTLKPERWSDAVLAVFPMLFPVWLVFFAQASDALTTPPSEISSLVTLYTWPLLATLATALGLSLAIGKWGRLLADALSLKRKDSHLPVALEQGIELAGTHRANIRSAALWLLFPVLCLVQLVNYPTAFDRQEFGLLLLLHAAFAWAWYDECRTRKSMFACSFAEIAVLAIFLAVRRQLTLTTSFWTLEYDIWASLTASFVLASCKKFFERCGIEQRVPALISLCLLPLVALAWILIHHLGSNMALLVLGLHSVIFMYMGKENRQSPFHVASVGSFIAFVCLIFWDKLELRALNAYVLPAGVGVLALAHLFRDKLSPETRTTVRLATVLSMMGSTAYYCLKESSTIGFIHLAVMIVLCLAAMLTGSFLRIKVYFFSGLVALITTLGVLVAKVAMHSHLDQNLRMTLLGAGVLGSGILLIAGAVYVKTHKDELLAKLASLKKYLDQWE